MKKILLSILFLLGFQFSFGQWNTDRILTIGKNALYFEDYVLSIQYFNQVIRIKPYLPEPYMFRGMAKINLEDYIGAEQDCTEAIEINPFIPQAYYARGFARNKLNKFSEAIKDFDKALEFSPNNAAILANRIESKEKSKDYEGAIQDLNIYRKLDPKTSGIDYEIGRIKLEQNDTISAIEAFDKYIASDTLSPLGYSIRALLKMQKKDEKGALEDYNNAIKRKSTFVGDYINRGILNVQQNNFKQALSDYNDAIKYDSKNVLAYYNRGLLRANLGDNNNAIGDLSKVVEMDTTNYEARLQKAYLELKVGDLNGAIKDFNVILKKYPFFVPAYYGIAEAKKKGGHKREAEQYRYLGFQIENNKDYYKRKQTIIAKNQMAKEAQKLKSQDNEINIFDKFSADLSDTKEIENKYGSGLRGNIQNTYVEVTNEKNFVLSYYSKEDEIRRTNTYYPAISQYNSEKRLPLSLKITNNEIALTAELINTHFEEINKLSAKISDEPNNFDLYFARAMEFALVQDFNSAIEDLNKTIQLKNNFSAAYFTRANLRYKLIEYQNNTQTKSEQKSTNNLSATDKYKIDFELIMRDYDKTIELNPDFSFAYYNKANVLCTLKDYKSAIKYYTKAIEIDPDFAEAYFNRGLTYLYLNDKNAGSLDVSKAGELGIYKAYNILKRLQE
ncbi:Tetratricopeptide TPR_1 repeat-containing protein [uncultured Paludibacter sp.]|uniref:Tetratricopeptide TPR_1 repeat-containing protein n=1 Tax=uncultured Paludibacter sp. TaxID=497635 RepID=A0A653A5Q8_9BACT|nr:Tetratricopeptide TPR_1 repeat-containing protein [uncultured Paludibacter sp.]